MSQLLVVIETFIKLEKFKKRTENETKNVQLYFEASEYLTDLF